MKTILLITILALISLWVAPIQLLAIEEAKYEVFNKNGRIEIREYAPSIVAETVVSGSLEDAGSTAFRKLFGYISGDNISRESIEMTAPVTQQASSEKIEMTAPLTQQKVDGKWAVSFLMPASYDMQTLPKPKDSDIRLREIPSRRIAALRYSGTWSKENYLKNKRTLEEWIRQNGFTVVGEPIWARYNSPFSLWFMRRNEILIPIEASIKPQADDRAANAYPMDWDRLDDAFSVLYSCVYQHSDRLTANPPNDVSLNL